MNYAKLDKSERLQRALKLLSDKGLHSTRDIIRKAHVCAVNSVIGELRMNGKKIPCKRVGGIYFYRLVG